MQSRCLIFLLAVLFSPLTGLAQSWKQGENSGSVSGRVLAGGARRGVPGAKVQVRSLAEGGMYQTETDRNGNFEIDGLRAGRYIVRVSAAGLRDSEQDVAVEEESTPVDIWLSVSEKPSRNAGISVSVRELSIPGKARKSFEKGIQLLAGGNAAGSIAEFTRAIAQYPSFYEAYYQLGAAQLNLGLGQDAADAFSKSIQVSDGRFAPPYFALSMVLSHESNFAEGDTLAKVGLSLEPGSLIGQFSLAWAELGLGHMGFAEKTLRGVLQRNPDFREARLLLLQAHHQQNNLPALIEDVEAYLKLDSDSAMSTRLRTAREDALRTLAQPSGKPLVAANAQP